MSIMPTKISGREMALCQCSNCAAEATIPALHGNNLPGGSRGKPNLCIAHEHRVKADLSQLGWGTLNKKILCPSCEAKRKAPKLTTIQEGPAMTKVTDLRHPTREQRRAIISILDDVYDTAAGRYKGAETDITVADAVGGGCMFGWVAEIRIETYGDSGDNEESGQQAAAIAALTEQVNAMQTALTALKLDVSRFADRQAAFAKTLGPKAKVC